MGGGLVPVLLAPRFVRGYSGVILAMRIYLVPVLLALPLVRGR